MKTWNTGDVLPASDLNTYLRDNMQFLHDQGSDIASAGTIAPTHQFHKVTGTTTITAITALAAGARVVLWFTGVLTVAEGSTLKLLGDYVTQANDTLELISDGTNWYEVSRSRTFGSKLFDSLLTGAAASFDLQGIPTTFAHLLVCVFGRGDAASADRGVYLRFNNDSGANYDWETISASAAAEASSESFGQTSGQIGLIPAATAGASLAGSVVAFVVDYANVTYHKTGTSSWSRKLGTGSTNFAWGSHAFAWRSTSAIDRVTAIIQSGNYASGSRCSIYGIA